MLREVGVPVTAGSVNDFGILDLNDQVEVFNGHETVIMTAITLQVQTSAFPHSAIATDAALTAKDPLTGTVKSFVVIKPLGSGDGALSKLMLRRA